MEGARPGRDEHRWPDSGSSLRTDENRSRHLPAHVPDGSLFSVCGIGGIVSLRVCRIRSQGSLVALPYPASLEPVRILDVPGKLNNSPRTVENDGRSL